MQFGSRQDKCLVEVSIGRDRGQEPSNCECPDHVGAVGTYRDCVPSRIHFLQQPTIMLEDSDGSTRHSGSKNEGGVVMRITDDKATLNIR